MSTTQFAATRAKITLFSLWPPQTFLSIEIKALPNVSSPKGHFVKLIGKSGSEV